MRYYVIAGEASGDLHGGNLLRALSEEDPHAEFRAWGGDQMQEAGADIVKHYRDLAFMGFWEVAVNLRTILKNMAFCKKDILAYQADVLILIDYPGFNLRIAEWAKKQGIRVFYYISPQLWAWNSSRVKGIKANVERLFVILPFEEEFYEKYDLAVDFVGHPLLDVVEDYEAKPLPLSDERPVIALLPGSRRQEIIRTLAIMLQVTSDFPAYQFVVAGAPAIPGSFYESLLAPYPNVHFITGQTYDLLSQAQAALVTSGTATLETALFEVPQVVCYRGGKISYWIARRVINVPYISLVNLILDEPLVKELIQDDFTPAHLASELKRILDPIHAADMQAGYAELKERLGFAGASRRTAEAMVGYLRGEGRGARSEHGF